MDPEVRHLRLCTGITEPCFVRADAAPPTKSGTIHAATLILLVAEDAAAFFRSLFDARKRSDIL